MPSTPSTGSTPSHTAAQSSGAPSMQSSHKVTCRCFIQMLTGLLSWLMALGVMIASYFAFYHRSLVLNEMLELAAEAKISSPEADHITLITKGSLAVAILAALLGTFIMCAVSCENRCSVCALIVLNMILCVVAFTFGGVALASQTQAITMTKKMMSHGIRTQYTRLDTSNPRYDQWRTLVDRIQMNGECCGVDNGPDDYRNVFPNVIVIANHDKKNYSACICPKRSQCGLQHLPFSCCKKVKNSASVNLSCALNVFKDKPKTSNTCTGINLKHGNIMYVSRKCDENLIGKMEHVRSLVWYGWLNITIAITLLLLSFLLIYLGCQWKGGKTNRYFAKTPTMPSSAPRSGKSHNGPPSVNKKSAKSPWICPDGHHCRIEIRLEYSLGIGQRSYVDCFDAVRVRRLISSQYGAGKLNWILEPKISDAPYQKFFVGGEVVFDSSVHGQFLFIPLHTKPIIDAINSKLEAAGV